MLAAAASCDMPFMLGSHLAQDCCWSCRYFYAQLGLGTPPHNFSTIIDTGSTVTYVPCANCAHCGVHMVCLARWRISCSIRRHHCSIMLSRLHCFSMLSQQCIQHS
jgi:hypothetical protein